VIYYRADGSRVLKPAESPTFIETYKEMEKLLETGKVKTIGVSNFSVKTLNELLPHIKVTPAVNQVEVHPCLPQDDLIKYCKERGIQVVAYLPLGNSKSSGGF
jgi:glycerol 2-dehydrogenase (NADP+)